MVKLRAKKLLALALSILMLTGTVTEWLPTALAVEEQSLVTAQAAPTDGAGEPEAQAEGQTRTVDEVPARQLDFQDENNGRPNLYVDFLGDNYRYGTAENHGHLVAPAAYNKDRRTNDILENNWRGYTSDDVNDAGADNIIFWVGVGVDRAQVWELMKNSEGRGITSLELGFYYNKTYIEPYTGLDSAVVSHEDLTAAYMNTIRQANIANSSYPNQWSNAFQLLHAETDLAVEEGSILRADPITQEELVSPSLDDIRANKDWKMTYVSLELTDLDGVGRQMREAYTGYETDAEGNPIIPPVASGTDNPPEYLMMIPFVVHQYDRNMDLCLRLIRDASHFSIGVGNDGVGDGSTGSYAAWERVTTRNKGKDLKLQLRFAGDLNIWNVTQARADEVFYEATLLIQNGGGSQNTARLSVQGDPGGTPVFVDRNNQTIQHLQSGTGMQLDLTVQSGYVATVWVYYDGDKTGADGEPEQVGWPFVNTVDKERDKQYTFVMPSKNTFVLVVFQPGNTRDYTLYLSEDPKPYAEGYMLGNETTVSSMLNYTPVDSTDPDDLRPVSITSFDPRESHPNDGHGPGPRMMVSKDQTVTVTVSTHPDYEARVQIYNFNSGQNMEYVSGPTDMVQDTTSGNTVFILPFGGTLTFSMPQSDVDVVVEYTEVETRTAKLEVWHDGDAAVAENVKDINIAQLAYLSYDKQTAVSTAYSGQVYEKVDPDNTGDDNERDHSAVHDPSYKTAWVPYSYATISNSLGGDTGRTGRLWSDPGADGATSLMAALSNATNESNLASRFNALDLLGADLLGDGKYMGLRKNLDGELYGDGELAEAATLLWELRSKVLADTAAGGLRATYYVEGTLADGSKYHYFDLTPAQVQAYRIACLEVDALFRDNRQAYRKAFQNYQKAKLIYDEVAKVPVTADATAPIPPKEPLSTQLTAATGLREYQGKDYQDDYLADYDNYITQYTAFITNLKDAGDTPTDIHWTYPLKDRPAYTSVPLLSPEDAKTAVQQAITTTYKWDDREVKDPDNHVETAAAVATRSGRTVWLLVEADSAYEVDRVDLRNEDGSALLTDPATGMTLEARPSASFKNVYTFSMPQENCIVRVHYKLRDQWTLQWQVNGANGEAENVAHIEAYQVTPLTVPPAPDPDWKNVYPSDAHLDPYDPASPVVTSRLTRPTLAKRTNEGHVDEAAYPDKVEKDGFPVEGLLAKSLVTVRVTCDDDYQVTVTARRGTGGDLIKVTSNEAAGVYTFTVPEHNGAAGASSQNIVLTVTYRKKSEAQHRAYIHVGDYDSPHSASNTGLWDNGSTDIAAMSDTLLHGEITLEPGYYIYTSYALGEHGSYPYTLDGNGYNSGAGAGRVSEDGQRPTVKLETTMPNEDLHVYIWVRRGLPPTEPANALTVVVLDEENTGSPVADNWAKATVYAREDDAKRVELPAAGKGATGAGVLQVTHYGRVENGDAVLAGDRVELDLSAAYDKGYYVAEVGLEPSHLGGDLEWLPADSIDSGERKLQFTMPAGSTTVTVRFEKLEGTEQAPSYYIYAMKTETDRDGNAVTTPDNKITTAASETIKTFATVGYYTLSNTANPERVPGSETGRGAGVAGEKVTMTFEVASGWYVQSVAVMTDGSAHPADFEVTSGDNNGGGGTFTASLVMPTGDAWFIVKYRQCPEDPKDPGHILPRPEVPEYALTLMVIDNDNVGRQDENIVTASFAGDEGMKHSPISASVKYDATAIQYIHAGDRVRLTHNLAPGYSMDYIIVNPTSQGIVPTNMDATSSQFTMPARNITVIAKIVKKAQQQYTADLILRPPTGMSVADLPTVGWGTFTNKGGSLTDYYRNAIYSLLLDPGKQVDFRLRALDGYYIRKVTVEPAVGTTSSLTGSFGYQSGGFVMPAANVHVNVFFEKLWPDEVTYDLTLKVHDASSQENNYAYFATAGGADFPAADQRLVHGGESYTATQAAKDGQEVCVTLNRETGFYYSPSTIQITDSSGAEIPFRMTATGIAFRMPPRSTTVEITFHRDNRTVEKNPPRQAFLHVDGTIEAGEIVKLYRNDGTMAGDFAIYDGNYISSLYAGDVLHLDLEIPAASKATRWVAAAYAVDEATGEQLMLPVTQVPGGGLNSFPVPTLPAGADATKPIHVYVTLRSKDEGDTNQTMSLVVQGPSGSGTATMQGTDPVASVTATAGATGSTPPDAAMGAIRAAQGSSVTVTMNPQDGYVISQLTVTDNQGKPVSYDWISMLENDDEEPSVWYPNPDKQITLTVPATGGTVWVVYAPRPTDPTDPTQPRKYIAQVVVNDEDYVGTEPSQNNAWLSVEKDLAGELVREKLVEARVGEWVDLDIVVQAGYRIMPIFVSPQSFGIKPQLYLGDLDSQTTGFIMPAGDVTVYVRFVRDGLDVYNATLVVEGYQGTVDDPNTGLGRNHATIHSDRTGTRGPIDSTNTPVSVQAAAVREWVTVKYYWDAADSWVSSVTVLDQAGRKVPFTQVDENTITLPMVDRDIIITVTYKNEADTPRPTPPDPPDPIPDPTPELTPVRLHVIDMSEDHSINTEEQGWGQVIYTPDGSPGSGAPQDSGRLTALPITAGQTDASWGHTEIIWVPAGRDVTLKAFSAFDQGIYIHSAYVLYRDGGQMIECNLKPNNKAPDDHTGEVPDPNHTPNDDPGFYWCREATFAAHPDYNDVYVYFTREKPTVNEFAATLMLKSPDGDTGSSAAIWTTADNRATVKANGDHGRIIAKRKDTVTVTVIPAEGYAIDYILMTPLGVPITPKRVGNEYTFSMPGYNVSICVYLKRSNEREFNATIHYLEQLSSGKPAPDHQNWGEISWTQDSRTANKQNPNSQPMVVNENATVTLDVTLDDPYVVLAAYVLQKDGSLVPLAPALEGTKEKNSQMDNSLADGTATFTMPSGDVDVFVVTTNDPPPEDWHTIVLVATDTAPSGNNSGDNWGYLKQEDEPDSAWDDEPNRKARSYGLMMPDPPGGIAHAFMTLPEKKADGSFNHFTVVVEEPAAGYVFNPNKSGLTQNEPVYVQSITPVTTYPRYTYVEPVGSCNRAVHLVFESTNDLKLTVEIEDPDNPGTPGKGMVENVVKTSTPGVETLELVSDSALGSYQIMSGLTAAAPVTFVVEPAEGYAAMAVLKTKDETTHLTLTPATDGTNHLNGTFNMPANDSTLVVTFFKPYTGTLVLRDLTAAGGHSAKMTEDTGTAPDTVNVSALTIDNATLEDLPDRTGLTARMVDFDKTGREKVTALLTETKNGSASGPTTLLTPKTAEDGVDDYLHTINRADATITLVVTDRDPDHPENDPYIAAVETVNKPDGTADPTIANTADTTAAKGDIWTTAHQNNTIQVHVTVPAGYAADVTAVRTDNNGNVLTSTPITLAVDGDVDFTMPAANVQVTVTYRKVEFTLTLRVVSPDGNTTAVTPDGLPALKNDKDQAVVRGGTTVKVSATPAANAFIRSITVQPGPDGDPYLVKTAMDAGVPYNDGNFTMQADTVVTVVYGAPRDPDNPKPDYYLAYSEVDDDTDNPANRVAAIRNISNSTLPDGSPTWAAGYAGNSVTVFYETAPEYYVTATAKRNSDDSPIPVVLLDHGTGGSATAAFPNEPSGDITITIHYHHSTDEPPKQTKDVALQLVGHKSEVGNNAQTNGGTLSDLWLNGTYAGRPPQYTGTTDPNDPVEMVKSAATTGDVLRTLAHWAANGHVIRMTVAVRHTADDGTVTETGEVDLQISRYAGSATSRAAMPTVGENEIAVIRVYYGSIYTATLHIEPHDPYNEDVNGNQTSTTDGRTTIYHHLSRLENLAGGETIATTAIPGTGQTLAGVVWESASGGASNAARRGLNDIYDFPMPTEDVDVYAFYRPENDNSYIAKVQFDGAAHLGDSRNVVTITNQSDPAAAAGRYWTAARAGETVVVNVKVADGYKAEIITTHEDKEDGQPGHDGSHHDFYISRTAFVPPTPALGKDAVFSMPVDTDATVIIRFTKGYDLSLEVKDKSGLAEKGNPNAADVDASSFGTLHAESNGTIPEAADGPLKSVDAGTPLTTNVTAATKDGKTAQYRVYRSSPFTGTVRVDAPPLTTADNPYPDVMPSADTVESVVFVDETHPLLAKVELRGESDINGNSATPIIDRTEPAPATATGPVWTTTKGGNEIKLRITVAQGYEAKIKVRRDNEEYYLNKNDESQWKWLDAKEDKFLQGVTTWDDAAGAATYKEPPFAKEPGVSEVPMGFQQYPLPRDFQDNIGGEEFFIFTMPAQDWDGGAATDVTVIVTFEFAGDIPQPFDPRNEKMAKIDLNDGFIYGENRGGFAVVEIPTLIQKVEDNAELFHTHNHTPVGETEEAKNDVEFDFFLYDAATNAYTPLTLGTDVLLEPYDPEDTDTYTAGDPYNYYRGDKALWTGPNHWKDTAAATQVQFTGSKFRLIPTEPDETTGSRTTGAQALYEMLQSGDGSLGKTAGNTYYTRLAVIARDAVGQKSAYTQVWIRPYFTIQVQVISYAPNHTTTASLYQHKGTDEPDKTVKPMLTDETSYTGRVLGGSKYYQTLDLKSSELLGRYSTNYDPGAANLLSNVDGAAGSPAADGEFTYALTLEKASCLTYTRVGLNLWENVGADPSDPTPNGYHKDTRTYTISDIVYLITGDVDGNGYTKWQDYNLVYSYVWRGMPWSSVTEAPDPSDPNYADWEVSTYNPESMAYRCDLNGDGVISVQDLNLVQTVFDYNRSVEDYKWTLLPDRITKVLPFGFGDQKNNYAALFALRLDDGEPIPVEPDEYWDSLVDPKATGAPPLDNPWVDENGMLWSDLEEWRANGGEKNADGGGEKTSGHRKDGEVIEVPMGEEAMDWPVYLPMYDPLDLSLPDDNGPGDH